MGYTVYRIKNRDIIKVKMTGKPWQPFYKSTGKNSGKPGEWVPIWFDKKAYADKKEDGTYGKFHRYGNLRLKAISAMLGKMEIKEGTEANVKEINDWLGYEN